MLACGRRWGKTTLGLTLAVKAAQHGERVWWVAPTQQMAFPAWTELKQALGEAWERKLENPRYIAFEGGGSITFRSAHDPDSLRGVGLDLVVIDEAAFMHEDAWFQALRPALADRGGRALILSTPRGRNWFWRVYGRGQDPAFSEWQSWHAPTAGNPLIGAAELAEARLTLSQATFAQEYEAAFLPDGGKVFHGVEQAIDPTIPREPLPGRQYVIGVDFGRYHDFTVAAVIDAARGALVHLERFNVVDWKLQRGRIMALARRYYNAPILAEANAIGEPNIEELRRERDLNVAAFTMTARSKPPLIEALVKAIGEGELRLIDDPALRAELDAFSYRNDAYGHAKYAAPEGMHDDIVIALALAWHLADRPRIVLGVMEG